MDTVFSLHGFEFEWHHKKSASNLKKHHVSFEEAFEVFLDPFVRIIETDDPIEAREAAIGYTEYSKFCLLCTRFETVKKYALFRLGAQHYLRGSTMKTSELIQKRLRIDRPMSTISLRLPEDVIEDLKRVAPDLGFGGYQPLIRAYIGKGLRADLVKLDAEQSSLGNLADSLRRQGVEEHVIAAAFSEIQAA